MQSCSKPRNANQSSSRICSKPRFFRDKGDVLSFNVVVVLHFKMLEPFGNASLNLQCRKRQLDYKSRMEPVAKRGYEFDVEVFTLKNWIVYSRT